MEILHTYFFLLSVLMISIYQEDLVLRYLMVNEIH